MNHIRKYIFINDVKSIKIYLSKLRTDTGLIGSATLFC